jgi:hypothetical protein
MALQAILLIVEFYKQIILVTSRKDPANMPVYLISDVGPVAPESEESWKAYLERAPAAIAKYGGRYLARGGAIQVIEGSWSPLAIV